MTTEAHPSVVARALLAVIGLYRATTAFRGDRCRFGPSCSSYALDAVRLHGAGRGLRLALRRIARCHPWNPGGHDPVPPSPAPSRMAHRS